MNGFKMISESYRKAAEQGKITQERADKECRIYDFLAACDQEDIIILFSSGVFNDITMQYLDVALEELRKDGDISKIQADMVKHLYYTNFDFSSLEVLQNRKNRINNGLEEKKKSI